MQNKEKVTEYLQVQCFFCHAGDRLHKSPHRYGVVELLYIAENQIDSSKLTDLL